MKPSRVHSSLFLSVEVGHGGLDDLPTVLIFPAISVKSSSILFLSNDDKIERSLPSSLNNRGVSMIYFWRPQEESTLIHFL
jgi:hypothetical protein